MDPTKLPEFKFSGKTSEVLINGGFGGFNISKEIRNEYERRTGSPLKNEPDRTDPTLIEIVKEEPIEIIFQSGDAVEGSSFHDILSRPKSSLYVEEIPEEYVKYDAWEIEEYDGAEKIVEDVYKVKYFKLIERLIEKGLNPEDFGDKK